MSKPSGTNSPTSSSVSSSIECDSASGTENWSNEEISQENKVEHSTIGVKSVQFRLIFSQKHTVVVIAVRIHLFPFRTEKLSSPSPMVLPYQVGE